MFIYEQVTFVLPDHHGKKKHLRFETFCDLYIEVAMDKSLGLGMLCFLHPRSHQHTNMRPHCAHCMRSVWPNWCDSPGSFESLDEGK